MKEVATGDTVGVFAGKSWGGKHALCVRLITVGKVAVCKKKETYKYEYGLFCFSTKSGSNSFIKIGQF